MAVSANRLELLQIADAVAREKSIDRSIVITAMEDAIAKAARSRYGAETDVHAEFARHSPFLSRCYAYSLGYRDEQGVSHGPGWEPTAGRSKRPIMADRPPL